VNVIEVDVVKAVPAAVPPAFIRRVLKSATRVPEIAARLPDGKTEIAIRITDDREMESLNRTYAGEAHATDVLSFEGTAGHLGDVAISWPAVLDQSARWGHDSNTEVAYLAVHGLLHLLGWDHLTRAQAAEMMRLTYAALALAGLKPGRRSIARWSGYTPVRGLRRSP
jgi:probable rRNA maturation factor